MASFGHVAAGMLAARLHGGGKRANDGRGGPSPGDGGGSRRRPVSWWMLLLFSGLALLPDADVLLVALGACDSGFCGHRGASHSFTAAIAIGFLGALIARRIGWPALRTGVATAAAVASHAVLDLLGEGGRGLPLLWPFSDERFQSPIRLFPDAPRGWALLSHLGLVSVATELVIFFPVVVFSLWPRIAAWRSARAIARGIAQLPITVVGTLEGFRTSRDGLGQAEPDLPHAIFIEGGVAAPPAPAPATTDEGDPPVRSAG